LKLKWRQSSPDRKIGLEKEEEAAVKKNGKSRGREQSAQKQLMLPLRGLARAALWDTVELMRRDLSGLALVAVMIDGVHFADHVVWLVRLNLPESKPPASGLHTSRPTG
jgi:hypothetical protein